LSSLSLYSESQDVPRSGATPRGSAPETRHPQQEVDVPLDACRSCPSTSCIAAPVLHLTGPVIAHPACVTSASALCFKGGWVSCSSPPPVVPHGPRRAQEGPTFPRSNVDHGGGKERPPPVTADGGPKCTRRHTQKLGLSVGLSSGAAIWSILYSSCKGIFAPRIHPENEKAC
jgi:hypothetical protein